MNVQINTMSDSQQIMTRYFDYCKEIGKGSVKDRFYSLKYFFEWFDTQHISLAALTPQLMGTYAVWLGKRYSEASSAQQRFFLLKHFFRWCYEEDHCISTPYQQLFTERTRLALPKVRRKVRESLSEKEMFKLLSECNVRYRALFWMFYNSMARVGAIHNIKLSDIDFEKKTVRIYEEKTNTENVIPLADVILQELKYYITNLRIQVPGNEYLFTTKSGKQYWSGDLTNITKRQSRKILKRKLTPHSFRHAGITHMIANGGNLLVISLMASHKSMTTTKNYYDDCPEVRLDEMRKSHPAFRSEKFALQEAQLLEREQKALDAEAEVQKLKQQMLKVLNEIK